MMAVSVPTVRAAVDLSIDTEASHQRVKVGETVTITVTASVLPIPTAPIIESARVMTEEHWKVGGQSISTGATRHERRTKAWSFELTARKPGFAQITPVVYYRVFIEGTSTPMDSVIGQPIRVSVIEVGPPTRWPWYAAGTLFLLALTWVVARTIIRRRLSQRAPLPEPIDEARQMMEVARVNRREDRAAEYPHDVESVILRFLQRRMAHDIGAAIPSEVVRHVAPFVNDQTVLAELKVLLTDCANARFGGGHLRIEQMQDLESHSLAILERVNDLWVSAKPTGEPGFDATGEIDQHDN